MFIEIKEDYWQYVVYVISAKSCQDSYKIVKKKIGLKENKLKKGGFSGMSLRLEQGEYALIIIGWDNSTFSHSVLFHEIFHITEYIMKDRDIKHSEKTSEAFAYNISKLTELILPHLTK